MAENMVKWPSGRGPISKIMPSDGCGRDTVPLAVERRYDLPEIGRYLGNVGLTHFTGSGLSGDFCRHSGVRCATGFF